MRTTMRTVVRKEHWRWQWCGKGRTQLRRVNVRESRMTLGATDARQLDLIERRADTGTAQNARRRQVGGRPDETTSRPLLRSYWRRQPHGPGNALRKIILIDVHA